MFKNKIILKIYIYIFRNFANVLFPEILVSDKKKKKKEYV